MKLRTKLSLLFGIVVLSVVTIVGTVAYTKSAEMGTTDARNTMQVSANLAAGEIFKRGTGKKGSQPLQNRA